MGMKIIGWVIIAILFFALIAIVAAVCFIIPFFEDKNEDERLYDLNSMQAKSNKDESIMKKETFIDNSARPVTRLPAIILPHFEVEKKTSTESTTTTRKTTPFVDSNKNMTRASTLGREWHNIKKIAPLYPQNFATAKYPVKQADVVDFGGKQKITHKISSPATSSSTSAPFDKDEPLGLEETTKFWLVDEEKKLMKKRESDG